MKNIKYLSVVLMIFMGLYTAEKFAHGMFDFSRIDVHPLNDVVKKPVGEITLEEAKAFFDVAFKDRSGDQRLTSGIRFPNHRMHKLVSVFQRSSDQESRVYLGRMLCIGSYLGNTGVKTPEEKRESFKKGFALIEQLAAENYTPAQLYLGAITLEPRGMFGFIHLRRIRLPRKVPGPDGIQSLCKRLIFEKDDFTEWSEIVAVESKQDLAGQVEVLRQVQSNIYLNICPRTNGYGPTYAQAIDYLEAAGNNGATEAWTILDSYFRSTLNSCDRLLDGSLPMAQSKAKFYKMKCTSLDVCEERKNG